MSKNICPECGEAMSPGERICSNCQYELTDAEFEAMNPAAPSPAAEADTMPQPMTASAAQMPGAPETVMAHGNVDASSHHTEDKSTHNVDQSHTVNNTTNTFIIMGGGAPLPPNIDPQTAAALQQVQQQQAQQASARTEPPAAPQAAPADTALQKPRNNGEKGIGSISGTAAPIRPAAKSNSKKWIGIGAAALAAIVIAVVFVVLRPAGEDAVPATNPTTGVAAPAALSGTSTKTAATTESAPAAEPAAPAASAAKPAVKKPKPVNHYEEGMNCLDQGDYANALHHLKLAAQANNGDAAYQLGEMYMNGTGVAANRDEAVKWYKIAAKAGNKAAKRKLF